MSYVQFVTNCTLIMIYYIYYHCVQVSTPPCINNFPFMHISPFIFFFFQLPSLTFFYVPFFPVLPQWNTGQTQKLTHERKNCFFAKKTSKECYMFLVTKRKSANCNVSQIYFDSLICWNLSGTGSLVLESKNLHFQ